MKIISLGGGAATVKRIRLSGSLMEQFINNNEDGEAIWNRLISPSPVFGWEDAIGEFSWGESADNDTSFVWQTQ